MPTTMFEPIVIKGFNTNNLRTTVYDILAHRALSFFSTTETYITKPAYYFEINQAQAFADAKAFAKFKFITKDTASNHYKAIQIYQSLLAFRLANGNIDALIDVDLLRLQFMYSHSTNDSKVQLYQTALQNIVKQNPNNAIAANANNTIAQLLTNNENDNNRIAKYATIVDIYEKNIKLYPKLEAGINAKNSLQQLQQKTLHFKH